MMPGMRRGLEEEKSKADAGRVQRRKQSSAGAKVLLDAFTGSMR